MVLLVVFPLVVALMITLIPSSNAAAQFLTSPAEHDSVSFAILPGISYNSDVGLFAGVKLNHYDFRGGTEPYRSFMVLKLAASTKGLLATEFNSDVTQTLGTSVRTDFLAFINRFPQDTYFGIGNSTDFESGLWDSDYYFFTSFTVGSNLKFRIPVYGSMNKKRLDIVPGAGISYEKPFTKDETLMVTDSPVGIAGGWFNTLSFGLNWENRDNEFIPSRGNRAEIRIEGSHPFLGSDFTGALVTSSFSQFIGFSIFLHHVLAMRISYDQALGEVPYWKLPALGGETTLRGYAFRRFRDNASVNYNAEFRNWFFHHQETGIRLGTHLFLDGGRVFDAVNSDDLVAGHHMTYGFGGVISGGRREVFIRVDVGFSDEMTRFYAGIGYMF